MLFAKADGRSLPTALHPLLEISEQWIGFLMGHVRWWWQIVPANTLSIRVRDPFLLTALPGENVAKSYLILRPENGGAAVVA
jgi:hypothetical protein